MSLTPEQIDVLKHVHKTLRKRYPVDDHGITIVPSDLADELELGFPFLEKEDE